MKICKRIVCMALCVVMAAMFAGCTDNGADTKENSTEKPLTYWGDMNKAIVPMVQSMGDTPFYREVQKQTGVEIEFVHPPVGQDKEQFELMTASGNMYDMVEYNWNEYPGGPGKAIDDGVILRLNDYIDKYAPNFKKIITEGELADIYRKGASTDTGDIFAFPSFNTGSYRTFGGPVIRKDWLDELGLKVPETIDEWTTVLRAFKEKKGSDAPLTGLSPYFLIGGNAFNGAYNIGKGLYLEGNTVKFGVIEPEFKAYVQQMHEWYSEGLLDNDFATVDKKIIASNMTTGKSGACIAFIGSEMGNYLSEMKDDSSYKLVAAPYPVAIKGTKSRFVAMENDVTNKYLALSTSCKNPEKAVQWIDYWYGKDGYMALNFGVEGVSYNMENGKPVYTGLIMNNPDGYTIGEALALYSRATGPAPGINQAPEYLEQYYHYPEQQSALKLWSENLDEAKKTEIPASLMYPADEAEECIALETDITVYCEEMVLKFIIGEEPMSQFDGFIEQLKTQFNVERYVDINQAAYNRYLQR